MVGLGRGRGETALGGDSGPRSQSAKQPTVPKIRIHLVLLAYLDRCFNDILLLAGWTSGLGTRPGESFVVCQTLDSLSPSPSPEYNLKKTTNRPTIPIQHE